jgi:tetratricopeptide (TPR) repeat protein
MIHREQMKPSRPRPRVSRWLPAVLLAAALTGGCAGSIRGPQLAAEYYNLGNGYYELGDYPKAIGYFRKALQLDAKNARVRFNLALALVKANQAEEARLLLEQLRGLDPENLGLLEALAFVYQIEGNTAEAESLYRHVLDRSPGSATARYNLAVLLEQLGRPEEALQQLETLLDNHSEDLEARFRAGSLQLALGRYSEAEESFLAYLQQHPDSVEAYLRLGDAYRLEESYDKALEAYQDALNYDEKQPDAWFYSSLIQLTSIDDPDRGLTALQQALDSGFRDSGLLQALLDSPRLLERERVREILEKHGLLPGSAKASQDQPPGVGNRAGGGH